MRPYSILETGFFAGVFWAKEGQTPPEDLNCVAVPPPENMPEGKRARLVNGAWVLENEPKTAEQIIAYFTNRIQARLDEFAKTKNYDGILSACTYATSQNPQFAAEGQRAVELRDATWAKGYELLAMAQASGVIPDWSAIESELPPLDWEASA